MDRQYKDQAIMRENISRLPTRRQEALKRYKRMYGRPQFLRLAYNMGLRP